MKQQEIKRFMKFWTFFTALGILGVIVKFYYADKTHFPTIAFLSLYFILSALVVYGALKKQIVGWYASFGLIGLCLLETISLTFLIESIFEKVMLIIWYFINGILIYIIYYSKFYFKNQGL